MGISELLRVGRTTRLRHQCAPKRVLKGVCARSVARISEISQSIFFCPPGRFEKQSCFFWMSDYKFLFLVV